MTVIASGSLAFDYIFTFQGHFADHILLDKTHVINVSFLVDSMQRRRGGVATNYAYTLALLGRSAAVLGALGADGGPFRDWLAGLGVDCTGLRLVANEETTTGFTVTDLADNQITGYYGGAMLKAPELSLDDVRTEASALIVGPSTTALMLKLAREARGRQLPYIFDASHNLPHMSGEDIEAGAEGAWVLIGNDYEMEVIRRRTGRDDADLLQLAQIVVTTHGRDGSVITTEGERHEIPPAPARKEVDPVGAGDAYRAGLVHALLSGADLEVAGRVAGLAASYAVEQTGTVEHRFTEDEFRARYRESFGSDLPF